MVDNVIKNYLTGLDIRNTPEEPNRQEMLRRLHEDYGYPKELMEIEFGVKKSPSDTRRTVPADIAVFDSYEDKQQRKPKIFVETKKNDYKLGKEQLQDYMAFEQHVTYGIWYNGSQEDGQSIAFFKKSFSSTGEINIDETLDVPKYKFSKIEEEIKRSHLKSTKNLKGIFKTLRGFMAANAKGTTRDAEILAQLTMLIIAKLYDEKYLDSEFVQFRVVDGNPEKTLNQINELLISAKERWDDVFDESDKITIDSNTLMQVVSQLQNYSLSKSPKNIISEAFESIISYATKGSQGQFFTPQNVVDLMVAVANPQKNESVFDPASGTAGFLIGSMFHVWNKYNESKNLNISAINDLQQQYAGNNLFGIEKDAFLSKIAKAYMAVLGDGRAGLFVEDSLDEIHWGKNTAAKIQQKKFDIVLTNPPFGKDVKVAEKTKKNFVFGNSIELAFIEKSLEHLKDGGVLGIILPETIFHAPSLNKQKVRRELFFNHNITHIIDLPHDTFRPYNNAKTDIIFLEKNKLQQENITVIKVNEIGHDHLGKEKFKLDTKYQFTNEVADDIPDIIRELSEKVTESNFIKTIKAEEVIKRDLLVARPYFSIKSEDDHKVTLGDLVDSKILKAFDGHGSPAGYLKGLGEYPYIRVKDIVNLEISHNRLDDIPEFEYKRLYSNKKKLQEKDLVLVRRGSYRIGDVGILYKKDINSILTREILVLRVNNNNANITPFNLLAILNSKEVRSQLENLILMDTTLPNIGDRWRLIKIDISNKNYLNKLTESGQSMYKKRDEFWQEYANLFGERG
ncbi:MAG: N-6 DNA methylase [Liquorilactobacillus nagelii]|uniref:N-6 DNA methylase n=2 Tax=Lactobacillaceae TaxID=33958 RepID=UPI0039E86EF6